MLDKIIKDNLKQDIDDIKVPDMTDILEHLNIEFKDKSTKNKIKLNKKISIIIIVLLLLWYANFLFQSKKDTLSLNLNYENSTSKFKSIGTHIVNIKDVKNISDFVVKPPKYIPNGYKFKNCLATKNNDAIICAELIYTHGKDIIRLKQEPISDNALLNNDYGNTYQFSNDGITYKTLVLADNTIKISWIMNDIKYVLIGNEVIKNDLKDMALSIQ